MHLITITLSMPLLSRRRRAVSAISRGRKSQFCAKSVHQIEDECIDIDDGRVSNFVDIDDKEGLDQTDDVEKEDIPLLSEEIVAKCYLWRPTGHKCGVRGAGTSQSTYKRRKKKLKKRTLSALTCRNITNFLVHKSENEPIILTSVPPLEADAIPVVTEDVGSIIENNLIPDAEINHEADSAFEDLCILDPCNILGDETVKEVNPAPPKHSMESAISHLLNEEGKGTRNKKIEQKNFLERYQTVQAMALIRYFQLILEGTEKMRASAKVANNIYNKKGIWSYKARSVRGRADQYLTTGAT